MLLKGQSGEILLGVNTSIIKEKIWRKKILFAYKFFYPRGYNFVIEYLNKIETEFENTLACLSGAQMGSNHEKNWRSKILWHTPFK